MSTPVKPPAVLLAEGVTTYIGDWFWDIISPCRPQHSNAEARPVGKPLRAASGATVVEEVVEVTTKRRTRRVVRYD